MKTRTLLFYTHALAGGGAERAWTLLASGFARQGHRVIMAVDYESNDNLPFLDPSVDLHVLHGPHAQTTLRLAKLIAREKPDATLSALCVSNVKHLIAATLAGRRQRAILSYHGFFESEPQALSRTSFLLTPILSRLSARTVAVSDLLAEDLRSRFRADKRRTRRVYNPVMWGGEIVSPIDLRARPPLVIACGRLVAAKHFDSLINAFARVEPRHARLMIIGEGPERPKLEAEIAKHGLQDRVTLTGYVERPWELFSQATCLAVSSRLESFGMVVVEALGHGLSVVSTDCKGPREILADGRYGRLVPVGHEAAMAGAISAALTDPGDPAPRLARAEDFSLDNSIRAYGDLIEDVANEGLSGAAHDVALRTLPGRT